MSDSLKRRTFHRVLPDGAHKASFGNGEFERRAGERAPDDEPAIVAVAEGDSWFDYPLTLDFLDHLQGSGWVNVWRESHFGHTLAQMIDGQLDQTLREVRRVKPEVFLLSCGGNDIMGGSGLLNRVIVPAGSRSRPNDPYLDRTALDEEFARLTKQLARLTERVLAVAADAGRPDLRILVHGYDYAWPDGRAVLPAPLIGRLLPGPWLAPALVQRGYLTSMRPGRAELDPAWAVVRELMDAWNNELAEFAERSSGAVVHVNLLGALTDRRKHWHNETHPNETGFAIVARRMLDEVKRVMRRA